MHWDQSHFIGENPSFLNVGTGEDITIRETAELIAGLVGYKGESAYESDQPDGTPQSLLILVESTILAGNPASVLAKALRMPTYLINVR